MAEKTLYGQLLLLQGSLEKLDLSRDAEGQVGSRRYKYLTLDKVYEQAMPLLGSLGLVWLTFPTSLNGGPSLRYVLRHVESGEFVEDIMPLLLSDQTSQGLGSAITYGRRYAFCAVTGIVPEDDDDGALASVSTARASTAPREVTASSNGSEKPATSKQRGLINFRASEKGLSPVALASLICRAVGEPKEFENEEHAQQWLKRAMDRLPWTAVNPVLEQIDQATVNSI